MIVYEVTTIVREDLIEKYEKYMCDQHIPDLLDTGYFNRAFFTRSETNTYRIQYHAPERDGLEEYLKNDAEQLWADFLLHFPEGVQASRASWEILRSW